MCGRGACTISADRCRQVAGGGIAGRARMRGSVRWRQRYNLGPQGYVPVVQHTALTSVPNNERNEDEAIVRDVCAMKWGLVPAFAKRVEDYDAFKGGMSTFNARIEGIETSNVWRRLLDTNRGVIVFDGFYEWKTTSKGKVPMFIRNCDAYRGDVIPLKQSDTTDSAKLDEPTSRRDCRDMDGSQQVPAPAHAPLLLAALCDSWKASKASDATDEPIDSTTIITMDPTGTPMEVVHNRMPIFLTVQTAALWLDPSSKFTDIINSVLQASKMHAKTQLQVYEVSPLVSNLKNESPDCILPKKDYDAKQLSKGLGRFFQKKTNSPKSDGKEMRTQASPTKRPLEEVLESPAKRSTVELRASETISIDDGVVNGGHQLLSDDARKLTAMGFVEHDALEALKICNGNVEAALDHLLAKAAS